MIYLVTGVPGAGKTLYALNLVESMRQKENRQVFYSGIRDLTLPWTALDEGDSTKGAEEWFTLPPGSIVVIDECQRVFRPRGHGTAVPKCVAQLETHRHLGIDLVLITQHPMLLDTNVRRLVGTHYHVMRAFGMHRAKIHEFTSLREQPDKSRADSVRHDFKYPRESFSWYKSAEVHTHKRRIPARVFFLALMPLILVGLGYGLFVKMKGYATGEATAARIQKQEPGAAPGAAAAAPGSAPGGARASQKFASTAEYVQVHLPRIPDLPHTAPIYDEVTRVVRAPYPAACIRSESRGCKCYTEQATVMQLSAELCNRVVEMGYYVAWETKPLASNSATEPRPARPEAPGVAVGAEPTAPREYRAPVVIREPVFIPKDKPADPGPQVVAGSQPR